MQHAAFTPVCFFFIEFLHLRGRNNNTNLGGGLLIVILSLPEELHEGKSIAVLLSDACTHHIG